MADEKKTVVQPDPWSIYKTTPFTSDAANKIQYTQEREQAEWFERAQKMATVMPDASPDLVAGAAMAGLPEDQALDAVALAQSRITQQAVEDRNGFFEEATGFLFDTTKGVARTGGMALDSAGQAMRNSRNEVIKSWEEEGFAAAAQDVTGMVVGFSTGMGFTGAMVQDFAKSGNAAESFAPITDTALGIATEKAVTEGSVAAGFGGDFAGDGFVVDGQSALMQEEQARSLARWMLENGDAGTLGRYGFDKMGVDKDSSLYKMGSGFVDFFDALLLDPSNAVPFGKVGAVAKAGKFVDEVAEGAQAAAATTRKASIVEAAQGKAPAGWMPSQFDESGTPTAYAMNLTDEVGFDDLRWGPGRLMAAVTDPAAQERVFESVRAANGKVAGDENGYLDTAGALLHAEKLSAAQRGAAKAARADAEQAMQEAARATQDLRPSLEALSNLEARRIEWQQVEEANAARGVDEPPLILPSRDELIDNDPEFVSLITRYDEAVNSGDSAGQDELLGLLVDKEDELTGKWIDTLFSVPGFRDYAASELGVDLPVDLAARYPNVSRVGDEVVVNPYVADTVGNREAAILDAEAEIGSLRQFNGVERNDDPEGLFRSYDGITYKWNAADRVAYEEQGLIPFEWAKQVLAARNPMGGGAAEDFWNWLSTGTLDEAFAASKSGVGEVATQGKIGELEALITEYKPKGTSRKKKGLTEEEAKRLKDGQFTADELMALKDKRSFTNEQRALYRKYTGLPFRDAPTTPRTSGKKYVPVEWKQQITPSRLQDAIDRRLGDLDEEMVAARREEFLADEAANSEFEARLREALLSDPKVQKSIVDSFAPEGGLPRNARFSPEEEATFTYLSGRVQEQQAAIDEIRALADEALDAASASQKEADELVSAVMRKHGTKIKQAGMRARASVLAGVDEEAGKFSVNTLLSEMSAGNINPMLDVLVEVRNPVAVYDLIPGISPSSAKRIAGAGSRDEISDALWDMFQYGELREASIRQLGQVARFTNTRSTKLAAAAVDADDLTPSMKLFRRKNVAARSNVPKTTLVMATDEDDMAALASDTITHVLRMNTPTGARAKESLDLYDELMMTMFDAKNAAERKAAYVKITNRLVEETPGWKDLDPAIKTVVMDRFNANMASRLDMMRRNAAAVADGLDPQFENLIIGTDQLNYTIAAPDFELLRRVVKNGVKIQKDNAGNQSVTDGRDNAVTLVGRMLDDVLDDVVKPALLFGRPGYIAYNMAVSQASMMANGMPNIFTHPIQLLGVAAAVADKKLPSFAKWMKTYDLEGVGVDGRRLDDPRVEEEMWVRIHAEQPTTEFARQKAMMVGMIDVVSERDASKIAGMRRMYIGNEQISPDAGAKFAGAVAGEAQDMVMNSSMNQTVLAVLAGGDNIPAWVAKKIASAQAKGVALSPQDVVVDYYFRGPGRKQLDEIRGAWMGAPDEGAAGQLPFAGMEGMPDFTRRSGVQDFLFSDEPWSVSRRLRLRTDDLNPDAVDFLLRLADQQKRILNNGTKALPDDLKVFTLKDGTQVSFSDRVALNDALKAVLEDSWKVKGDAAVKPQVALLPKAIETESGNIGKARDRVMDVTSWFFKMAGKGEWNVSQGPMFAMNYWEGAAQRIVLLSPDEAQKVLANGRKALGGLKSAKAKETLAMLERGAAKAQGDGSYTMGILHRASEKHAASMHGDMTYNAFNRNQMAYSMRLAIPFAQAAMNGYKVFGKAVRRNPRVLYRFQQGWQALEETGSNAVYEAMGFEHDPSQGFIWQDERGAQYFSVPLLGYVRKAVTFGAADAGPWGQTNAPVNSWNVVNGGMYLPGVGLAVTVPVRMLMDRFPSFAAVTPDGVKAYVDPMKQRNPDLESPVAIPPWMQQGAEALGVGDSWWRKDVAPAMAALVQANPEKYLETDPTTGATMFTASGQQLLARDAESMARQMQGGKALMSATFRSNRGPKAFTDMNGEQIMVAALTEEFDGRVDATGDRGAAMFEMVEKYGPQAVFFLSSPYEYMSSASSDGMRFVVNNEEFAFGVSDVIGYFYPPEDPAAASVEFSRWQASLDKGDLKSPQEYLTGVNKVLRTAASSEVDRLMATGQITRDEARERKKIINEEYTAATRDSSDNRTGIPNSIMQLQTAVTNEELAGTPAGAAISEYLLARDAALQVADGSLEGEGDAAVRAKLLEIGEGIAEQEPAFLPVWENLLMKEVLD